MEKRLNEDIKRIKEQIEIGNYDKAIRISNVLVYSKIPKVVVFGLLYKGLALSFDKQYQESIAVLNRLVSQFPNTELAYLYRCDTYIKIGEFEKALNDSTTLIGFDPYNFEYISCNIRVNQFLGNFQNVVENCSKILYYIPEQSSFIITRAQAKGRLGLYEKALIDYQKVLSLIEENNLVVDKNEISTLFNDIGYYLGKTGNFNLAKYHLEKSLAFNNIHPYALNNLGFVLAQIGEHDHGLQLINQSLKLNSANSYAYKNRAKILISLGQLKKAKLDLLEAKKLDYHLLYDNEVDHLLSQLI